jgi:type IV pilus assembly protein PilV
MRKTLPVPHRQGGVMLLEALVAILIFSIGILAVVGMQSTAIKNVTDAKYRNEAAFLADELSAQMWTDAGNIASYAYSGTGTVPARLTDWISHVNSKLPSAAVVPPIVTVAAPSSNGAVVTIQVRWLTPEELNQTPQPPAHNVTLVASVYTS